MTDQPDARTQRPATNSDQATQSPQEHKSTMQKIKEMIPGTKAHKAKKAQKAGVPQETGMPQDEVAQPFEGNQMQQPRGSLGGTSDPDAREQMASGMGTGLSGLPRRGSLGGTSDPEARERMASSMMGGTPSMEDSSSDPRAFFQYVQQQWQQMDDSLGESSDSRAFFQYVQQQWQRMEVLSHEADLSKNDTSMGTGTSPNPLAEQNVYAGNTGHPIGMDDRHLTYGSTVDTRGPGLQHGPLGGTHAQTGTLHRASEPLPASDPLTDKESRKADYTGTNDTGSGLETTRRGVEQM